MKKNILNIFLDKLYDYPLWVKQVIFVKLKRNLEKHNFNTICENSFSMYSPVLTFSGKSELADKKCGFDNNIYNFLECCGNNFSLLDIALTNYWSMEETAKYFEFTFEQRFVKIPQSKEVYAMCGFISGKFRTGEYFLNKGSITREQLNQAVEMSQNSENRFAKILADLGYISYNDAVSALVLKEESQMRFVLDYNITPKYSTELTYGKKSEKEIENLKQENKKLKQNLTYLSGLVKNDSGNFD